MRKLFLHPNIYVDKSPVHGYGVFTDSFLPAGTIIEEATHIKVCDAESPNDVLAPYRYSYPQFEPTKYVVALGYASLYNHSQEPNATWYIDFERDLFIFKTIKNIFANQEIFTYYGDETYWKAIGTSINNNMPS